MTKAFFTPLIPLVVVVLGVVPLFIVISVWLRRVAKRNRRSPLTQNMLRSPGQSQREMLTSLDSQLQLYISVFVATPFVIFGVHVSQSYFGSQPESAVRIIVSVIAFGIFSFLLLRRVVRMADSRRKLVLGLEGEMSTGEELNQLMLSGCRVFHDIPFDYGNIDHVVVSTSGVFAVETKMVGKLKDSESAKARFDPSSDTLKLSGISWKIPRKQLETNANWLSKYLTKAVGRQISVEAMLALPGYFVERPANRSSVFVFNPKEPKRFFVNSRNIFTPEQVAQIAHQVEQLCRNVEPSFGYEKVWK